MVHLGGWVGKSSDTSISRLGSSCLDLDVNHNVKPRWLLSQVVWLVNCWMNLVKEHKVALWSARNRICCVRTKTLFCDQEPNFILVPLNLYVNRNYSVVYQSSLASLVLSGWLHWMNLVSVP